MTSRGAGVVLASLGAALLLTACSPDISTEPAPNPTAPPAGQPPTTSSQPPVLLDQARAQEALESLRLTERVSPSKLGYTRSAFGSSWSDTDGNGCNQRDDVLLRDSVPGTVLVVKQGACDHDVVAGSWVDPYIGREISFDNLKDQVQAQGVQIDHVVPLAEAWVSGAADWPEERRRSFANDLDELLAVDGPTNSSKSDGDPAAWRPKKQFQCDYARRWIGIKATWELSVDESERSALSEMLSFCGG